MRAGYMPAVGVAEFRDDMPEPQIEKADDVKIRVRNCGICGSEVHAIHGLHPFRIPPLVSGHEVAGEVIEVGPDVTKFSVGDRVTVEPHYGCGHCWYCEHGLYNVCPNKKVPWFPYPTSSVTRRARSSSPSPTACTQCATARSMPIPP